MGRDVFGQIRVIDKIASSDLKFIPENLIIGGGGGGQGNDLVNGLFGIALLENLSGKRFASEAAAGPAAPDGDRGALAAAETVGEYRDRWSVGSMIRGGPT